jgi:Lyzozyme M1 (1,4-beta-N-acetylmuramidase)
MKKQCIQLFIGCLVVGTSPVAVLANEQDMLTEDSTSAIISTSLEPVSETTTSVEQIDSDESTEQIIDSTVTNVLTDQENETTDTSASETIETESNESSETATKDITEETAAATVTPEIITADEFASYPQHRSDLKQSKQKVATFASIPSVQVTDKNIPPKSFIDVSSWNGPLSVNDYNIIKSYGVTGVVVKLTEGTSYTNPYINEQVNNAKQAGLKVSAYHYSHFYDQPSAYQEAEYFASVAKKLGLDIQTVMVNDIEEPSIGMDKDHTANSKYFEQRLNQLGYQNIRHYVGLNWINQGLIDPDILGFKNMWVAAYPYTLTSDSLYTDYGAWQWSSELSFPGVVGTFDISADYNGDYYNNQLYQSYGKYVTVTSENLDIYQNFNWAKRDNSVNYYGKPLLAKGFYYNLDGNRYLSLYDKDNRWIGYINEAGTQLATGKSGFYQSYGEYVTIKSKNYDIWQNFSWKKKDRSSNYYGQVLLAKGYYDNFNGSRYLSLYDKDNQWIGYINEAGTQLATGKSGFYQSYGEYVTVKSKNYDIWQNFNWKKRDQSSNYYGQVLLAKGYYDNFNGSRYLSIYDKSNQWIGYINENSTILAKDKSGFYQSYGAYVTVKSRNYDIWQNFNWKKRDRSSNYYGQVLLAKGYYENFNGSRYLSLYGNDKWIGYINQTAVQID